MSAVPEILNKHERELAVHKERLDNHDEIIRALISKLDQLQLTMLAIGGGLIAAIIAG